MEKQKIHKGDRVHLIGSKTFYGDVMKNFMNGTYLIEWYDGRTSVEKTEDLEIARINY